jgi:hypothetical protein
MLHVTVAGWAATLALIAGLLILDWLLLGRRPHAVRFGEAARWSAFSSLRVVRKARARSCASPEPAVVSRTH